MLNINDKMQKFKFLIGRWKLVYEVSNSDFGEEDSGEGIGEFKYILNNKFVSFEYKSELNKRAFNVRAIFGWDEKNGNYKYWWFEDTGTALTATCDFIDENTLYINWHDTLLTQTFKKLDENKVILDLKYPKRGREFSSIMKVTFTKIEFSKK